MRSAAAAAALRVAIVAAAAALAAACGGAERGAGGKAGDGSARSGAGSGTRGRVVIVGVDGADWQVIRPLVEAGRLPAFRRLMAEGASGDLRSFQPSASPSLWTTVATGVLPERHGIHGFVTDDAGRPVTSTMRRAPAFWNILSAAGLKTGVVGWLVTWPAEPVNGFVVSSYLPYIYNWSTGRPLKGTIVSGIPRQTFPEGLIDTLEPLKVKPEALDAATIGRFYDARLIPSLSPDDQACVEGFLWSLACDETYRRIGLKLFDEYPVDVFAVYFGGVDVASHRFWKFAHPGAMPYGVKAGDAATLGRVIDQYYAWVDEALAEYLRRLGPDDTLVVLSDHGFKPVWSPDRPTTSGHHRDQGILALLGRGVPRGGRIEGASLLDVLPTILNLVDAPVARDLAGKVPEGALDPRFAAAHPPRYVEAYAAAAPAGGPESSDLDRNVLERLRSLGYIN